MEKMDRAEDRVTYGNDKVVLLGLLAHGERKTVKKSIRGLVGAEIRDN